MISDLALGVFFVASVIALVAWFLALMGGC